MYKIITKIVFIAGSEEKSQKEFLFFQKMINSVKSNFDVIEFKPYWKIENSFLCTFESRTDNPENLFRMVKEKFGYFWTYSTNSSPQIYEIIWDKNYDVDGKNNILLATSAIWFHLEIIL